MNFIDMFRWPDLLLLFLRIDLGCFLEEDLWLPVPTTSEKAMSSGLNSDILWSLFTLTPSWIHWKLQWYMSGLFFGHQRKNSRRKNSKLKEKTQNSRTKLKFSAFKSGEIEVNIGMKCFFTSTLKGKDYGKYQKGTINLKNMNRSQNSSKTL